MVSDQPEVFERPDPRMIAQPIQPAAANELSEDGARAFAYYFLDVLNYTAATGNTELLESISGPECTACQGFIEASQQDEEKRHWTEGFNATFVTEPEHIDNTGVAFAFSVKFHSDAYETWSTAGKVEDFEALTFEGAIVIYRLGNYWLVEEFGETSNS